MILRLNWIRLNSIQNKWERERECVWIKRIRCLSIILFVFLFYDSGDYFGLLNVTSWWRKKVWFFLLYYLFICLTPQLELFLQKQRKKQNKLKTSTWYAWDVKVRCVLEMWSHLKHSKRIYSPANQSDGFCYAIMKSSSCSLTINYLKWIQYCYFQVVFNESAERKNKSQFSICVR